MAVWFIASLFFNDTHYSQIGGPAADGHDVTSRMSYLILEASHLLKIPSNLAVRLHDGLDPDLLRQSLVYNLEDGTGPSYSCAKGLDEGYIRNGVPLQLARLRAKVGCNWTALPGIEYCHQDVTRQCLIAPFLLAFNELVDDPARAPHAGRAVAALHRTPRHLDARAQRRLRLAHGASRRQPDRDRPEPLLPRADRARAGCGGRRGGHLPPDRRRPGAGDRGRLVCGHRAAGGDREAADLGAVGSSICATTTRARSPCG